MPRFSNYCNSYSVQRSIPIELPFEIYYCVITTMLTGFNKFKNGLDACHFRIANIYVNGFGSLSHQCNHIDDIEAISNIWSVHSPEMASFWNGNQHLQLCFKIRRRPTYYLWNVFGIIF